MHSSYKATAVLKRPQISCWSLHLDGVVLAVQQVELQSHLLSFVCIWSSSLQVLSSQQQLFDCPLLTVLCT